MGREKVSGTFFGSPRKQREIKGQAICAFVSLKAGMQNSPALVDELKGHVAKKIGPIARPDEILFAAELSNTRIVEVSDLPNLLNFSSPPAVRIKARPRIQHGR